MTAEAADSAAAARVAASADAWRRKLLDLTKRNRLLHFRVNKVSTITVVDEMPAEVFRTLYLRDGTMRFKAAPEKPDAAGAEPAAHNADEARVAPAADRPDDDFDDAAHADFVPYDASTLEGRHGDDSLQTTATAEALDHSLRRLDEQARLSIEEQGVNTLFIALGMLHYTESAQSEQVLRAPLVLLPVTLTRRSARSGYTVKAAEDDPIVNPALMEHLRRDHGITIPDLPDTETLDESYDLQTFFVRVADAVAGKPGWAVKASIYVGVFAFQKLVMYKDLEKNGAALTAHRLVRQLVTRTGDANAGSVVGLPPEIRDLDLDSGFPPESTYQVVDADSSQLRAVAAVAGGHDVVIEGPPGTGKSQTITNLIARALAAGKSVLFVAEKMAALSVVHDRLVRAGLGEFCLELHSTKANKRAVMKELAAALDASLQRVAAPTASTQRLPSVRAALNEYVRAVHAPFSSLGVSPWRAFGELGVVLDAKRVRYGGPVDGGILLTQIEDAARRLRDLAAAAAPIGAPAQHPWRDTTRTFYSAADLEMIDDLARRAIAAFEEVRSAAAAVEASYGLPAPRSPADVAATAAIAATLARSPGAPPAVLANAAWNAAPHAATSLIERGRALQALEASVLRRFAPDVLERDHAGDIAHIERKSSGALSFLAFLDARYREIRNRWRSWRTSAFTGSLLEQANAMRDADRVRAERREFEARAAEARELFGELWRGWRSDWDALDAYVRWVVEFRQICVRHGLSGKPLALAAAKTPDVSAVGVLEERMSAAGAALAELTREVGWPGGHLSAAPFDDVVQRARELVDNLDAAPRWAAFEASRQEAMASLAKDVVPAGLAGEVPFPELPAAFLRAFWFQWIAAAVKARPVLERFSALTHEERIREFRELDRRVLLENRSRLVGELRDRVQHKLRQPETTDAMSHLRRELARQRGLAPLRKTIRTAAAAIRAIKPCFMMSPLTVAQLLEGGAPEFDLVIFDEASQLPPEDAVGAVVRGRQLVVVGDPKQLPPTNFFAVASGVVDAGVDEEGTPLYEDAESILEEFMGAGFPTSRLKWHYRSTHESLITFSNVQFYDADLYTFPSVERDRAAGGLQFELVADGVYEGKGLNMAEARRVASEVMRFAKEQLERRARGEAPLSLGVGTFNLRQQIAIQDELERLRRDDLSTEAFFDRGAPEPFFVKNLENIQGDERDVIFLSVTYARGADGRMRYQLGPLNGENGWRRLNVLTTRARERMCVFSSIRGEDVSVVQTASRGARLLREFLTYAEHGRLESAAAALAAETESPFERDVLQELTQRGLAVVPQVGDAGYRIDLGIVDDAAPGRFVCGVECDGVAYHSSESARDRDRLRQQVLENRGWTIFRVWSTDWFKDRRGQIERLVGLIEEARTRARDDAAAAEEARSRAAAEAEHARAEAEAAARIAAASLVAEPTVRYERPAAAAYVTAQLSGYERSDILAAPISQLVRAVVVVAEAESPVHVADLISRVASFWGSRPGSRIQARIEEALTQAADGRLVARRGQFVWAADGRCTLRSRAGTRIPGDRIAPEEYELAVEAVLRPGHGFSRAQLTTEVRALLGFARTVAILDECIAATVDRMLASGRIGESSTGVRWRG